MLRALVLALNDNPGWEMGDTHRGVGHVDMLAARASGTEGVDAKVVQLDIDLDFVVDLGVDEYRRERRMPASVGVEGRDAHEAMHADLRLQKPIRIRTVNFESSGLDARPFAFETVGKDDLEVVAFGPAEIHTEQHFGPVLRFGAAGAGVDGHDGVAAVVLTGEEHAGFEMAENFGEALELAFDIAVDGFAFPRQFEERIEIVGHALATFVVAGDGLFETLGDPA